MRYLDGEPVTRDLEVVVPALVDETPLEETALPSVLLSDDFLQNAAAKEHEYLLSLDSETFLYEFYKVGGLTPTTAAGYGGWERSNAVNFRGHAFGHYLSALAMSWSSTQDEATKDALFTEIEEGVGGLARVQDAYAASHPARPGTSPRSASRSSTRCRAPGRRTRTSSCPGTTCTRCSPGCSTSPSTWTAPSVTRRSPSRPSSGSTSRAASRSCRAPTSCCAPSTAV